MYTLYTFFILQWRTAVLANIELPRPRIIFPQYSTTCTV